MAEEFKQKDNSGSLFTNGRKEKESHPDFTGRIKIGDDLLEAIRNGDELQLSAWKKTTKNGQAWLSLSVGKVYRKPENSTPRASPPSLDDGEAPF